MFFIFAILYNNIDFFVFVKIDLLNLQWNFIKMTTPNQIPTVVPRLEKETQVIEGFITSFHWDTGKNQD